LFSEKLLLWDERQVFPVASFTLKPIGESRMSKSMNSFKIVAIAVVAMALSASSAVLGQQQQNPIYNRLVCYVYGLIDLAPGSVFPTTVIIVGRMLGTYWDPRLYDHNDPDSFPTSHLTRPPHRRPIAHFEGIRIEGTRIYPPGTYFSDNPFAVSPYGYTADAANRLWDDIYITHWGYTKVDPAASIDPSMNCHGFSTGRNSWIWDMGTLVADEYEPRNRFCDNHLVPGAIFFNPNWINAAGLLAVGSHSARIEYVGAVQTAQNPPNQQYRWIRVIEKNRVSALYERWFVVTVHPGNPDVVQPIVLPWGTFSHFHVKKP